MTDSELPYTIDTTLILDPQGEPALGSILMRVRGNNRLMTIGARGYGEKGAADGEGTPIVIEVHDGELRLLVWSDINSEDPTHIISLQGAMENKRRGWVFADENENEIGFADADEYRNADHAVDKFGRSYGDGDFVVYFRNSNGELCPTSAECEPTDFR